METPNIVNENKPMREKDWVELDQAEQIERLADARRAINSLEELRGMFASHGHLADGSTVVKVENRPYGYGSNEAETGRKPG